MLGFADASRALGVAAGDQSAMEAANPIPHATDAPRVVLATQAAVEHIAVEAEAKLNGNGPVAQIEPSGQHTGAKRKSVWHKGKRSHADPEAQDAGKALQLDTSVLADAGTVANEKADTMTEEELVQRRLAHVQQLYKLYKVQHWSALEELRTRHQHFYQTHQRTGWKDPSVVAVEPAQKGSPARSLRSILRSRPATRRAAGGSGGGSAAANGAPFDALLDAPSTSAELVQPCINPSEDGAVKMEVDAPAAAPAADAVHAVRPAVDAVPAVRPAGEQAAQQGLAGGGAAAAQPKPPLAGSGAVPQSTAATDVDAPRQGTATAPVLPGASAQLGALNMAAAEQQQGQTSSTAAAQQPRPMAAEAAAPIGQTNGLAAALAGLPRPNSGNLRRTPKSRTGAALHAMLASSDGPCGMETSSAPDQPSAADSQARAMMAFASPLGLVASAAGATAPSSTGQAAVAQPPGNPAPVESVAAPAACKAEDVPAVPAAPAGAETLVRSSSSGGEGSNPSSNPSSRPSIARSPSPFASPQLQGYREKKLCDLSDLEAALQGEGSDEEAFTFSDAEEAVLELDPEGTCADKELLAGWRCAFRTRLTQIARLEQSASAASARDLDSQSALAALCGRKNRFLIRRTSVTLGRTTETHGQVDVDLSAEGDARKVSRQQAQLTLMPDGKFLLQNTGRRSLFINGRQVDQAQVTRLDHLSVIEAAGIRLLFMVNHLALRRVMTRSANFTV